jgi:hypothetical protein
MENQMPMPMTLPGRAWGADPPCILRVHCYADVMATTKKRTTRPLSSEDKTLLAEIRAAKAKGESLTRVLYKAMSPDEKRAFVQRHAK